MENLDNIVVTEVTNKNIKQLWTVILNDVEKSSFIAIDAEMSGLGSTKNTMCSNLDDRYHAICSAAKTRSIISLGLACFGCVHSQNTERLNENEQINNKTKISYKVAVYNILLLCSDPYTIDPNAVKFLIEHGFNFNKQFSLGIAYHKGNDKYTDSSLQFSMRKLFSEMIRLRKPLVLHNGFTDLIFMYECFYAECPSKLTAFMADLSEIFPSGIYDTKYIAEFCEHASASFLLYIFKSSYLKNIKYSEKDEPFLCLQCAASNNWSSLIPLHGQNSKDCNQSEICEKYSAYGWCVKGSLCPRSHNIDAIIQAHAVKANKSRKRKHKNKNDVAAKQRLLHDDYHTKNEITTISQDEVSSNKAENKIAQDLQPSNSGHRSGLDSFMTGYAFAMYIVSKYKPSIDSNAAVAKTNDSENSHFNNAITYLTTDEQKSIVNKLYLSGKNIPLPVCKSQYTKTSKNHNDKLLRVYLS